MTPFRRSSTLAPGSAFLAGLLLVMLGLSGVLAYQAVDAARSEARSTERALRGYASFATWELVRRAESLLDERLQASSATALPLSTDSTPLPELATSLRGELAWCDCEGVRGVFRMDGRGRVETAGAGKELEGWLRGGAQGSALAQRLGRGWSRDTILIEAVAAGGYRHLLVYRLSRTDGVTRATGFAADPARLASPVIAEVFGATPLLPASPRGAVANREALLVLVTSRTGEVVYRSAGPPGSGRDANWADAKIGAYRDDALAPGEVVEALDGLFAGMAMRVAVRPKVAAGLATEEPPQTRVPLLLTVFGLTLALVCVAIVQLRRQQELVRLRDDFVSGVSHELRTPLAQIRLFADLLESERLTTPEQRRRSVRIIDEESRRLTYLVENILHFSRAQRGASRISPAPVEVGPLVEEIVESFAPLARAREAEFVLSLDPGVVARIDPDALRQILLNLLDNAVKYGPVGQSVAVGTELSGFHLRLWVDDRGPGVPREERAKVWEAYRRLERDAHSATGGSGIGLAVVRDLVELHGGRAGIGDAPGGGARFWVEFPAAMYAGPAHDDAPTPEAIPVEGAA